MQVTETSIGTMIEHGNGSANGFALSMEEFGTLLAESLDQQWQAAGTASEPVVYVDPSLRFSPADGEQQALTFTSDAPTEPTAEPSDDPIQEFNKLIGTVRGVRQSIDAIPTQEWDIEGTQQKVAALDGVSVPTGTPARAVLEGIGEAAYFLMVSTFREKSQALKDSFMALCRAVVDGMPQRDELPGDDAVLTTQDILRLLKMALLVQVHKNAELKSLRQSVLSLKETVSTLETTVQSARQSINAMAGVKQRNTDLTEQVQSLQVLNENLRKDVAAAKAAAAKYEEYESRMAGKVHTLGERSAVIRAPQGYVVADKQAKRLFFVEDVRKATWFPDTGMATSLLQTGVIGAWAKKQHFDEVELLIRSGTPIDPNTLKPWTLTVERLEGVSTDTVVFNASPEQITTLSARWRLHRKNNPAQKAVNAAAKQRAKLKSKLAAKKNRKGKR